MTVESAPFFLFISPLVDFRPYFEIRCPRKEKLKYHFVMLLIYRKNYFKKSVAWWVDVMGYLIELGK
jgi:hypothetical protein